MALQAGPPYFIGRMGNFIGFKRNGKYYMKAAPSGELDNSRSNNAEMGAGSTIGKVLRESLPSLIEQFNHSYLNSHLSGIFNKILQQSKKSTGQRHLDLITHKSMLVGFEFSKNNTFDQKCNGTWYWIVNDRRDRISLNISKINATVKNKNSEGWYYRIIVAATILSPYIYDANENKYRPSHEAMNGKSYVSYSKYITLSNTIYKDEVILDLEETIPKSCFIITLIGIEFFKQEGDEMNLMITHQALKIAEVF